MPPAFLDTKRPLPIVAKLIGRDQNVPVQRVSLKIHGEVDRAKQARTDVTTFNSVRLDFTVWGADNAQAASLIEGFKRR